MTPEASNTVGFHFNTVHLTLMSKLGFWASPAGQKQALRSTPGPRQAAAPSSMPRWGSSFLPWARGCVTKLHWTAFNSSWLSSLHPGSHNLRSGCGQGRAPSRGPRGGSVLPPRWPQASLGLWLHHSHSCHCSDVASPLWICLHLGFSPPYKAPGMGQGPP